MAARNNVTTVPAASEVFAMPEVFTQDDIDDPQVPSDAVAEVQGLTLEQLNNLGFNDAQDEAEYSKINPPVGDWTKSTKWDYVEGKTVRINTGDSMPSDKYPTGRLIINVSGRPEPRIANGLEYCPFLFLRISFDKRYKEDGKTVDIAYKLALRAKELYLQLYGKKPTDIGQIVQMLCKDEYVLRTMNGDNGPIVLDIKAKRVPR